MKFTLAFLSLATAAFAAPTTLPVGGDPTKIVAGVVGGAGVGAALKPLGVVVGAVTGAAAGLKLSPRGELAVSAAAAAGARVGLGHIPVHAPKVRRDDLPATPAAPAVPDLKNVDVAALEAKIAAAVAAGVKIGRRDVQTIDAALAPVEVIVKGLVAQIGSKTITLAEAQLLLPKLTSTLIGLKASLKLLAPLSKEVSVILGTDDCHTIAIRIADLIDEILEAVNCLETVLVDNVKVLKPLVIALNVAIQDVLDIVIGLVAGLDALLTPLLKPLTVVLKHLGLNLHVGLFNL